MKDIKNLEEKLGIQFKNQDILKQAMVHRSYINEHPGFGLGHNERLEFLGDAVLELAVTEYLYENYPDSPEGDLTNWRASLVNSHMLSELAQELGIEEFLYLSKGESKDKKGKARQFILANAYEALIGAIHLDQKYKTAEKFILKHLMVRLENILENELYLDPKSRFQETTQDKFGVTPTYKVLDQNGPDHSKTFKVGVYIEKEMIASGTGTSKQEAQVKAAEKAIKKKGW